MRVENAFPAIVSSQEFDHVQRMMASKAPKSVHPRRAASPYLLSGLVKCEKCDKALTAQEAKSGKYTYYVCHSLLKMGRGTCKTPRLNSKRFEKLIVGDAGQDGDRRSLREGHGRLSEDERPNRVEGVHQVVRQGDRGPAPEGDDPLHDSHSAGQSNNGR